MSKVSYHHKCLSSIVGPVALVPQRVGKFAFGWLTRSDEKAPGIKYRRAP